MWRRLKWWLCLKSDTAYRSVSTQESVSAYKRDPPKKDSAWKIDSA